MEDYTKFRLKGNDELIPLLEAGDDLFILACNKCFKEFTAEDEPECDELAGIAAGLGKKIAGCAKLDFLCNKTLTQKRLVEALPQDAAKIIVVACGLGIQTIADIADLPVCAATDSVSYGGRHGMALTQKLCQACGQCYLNLTGGICPIVDCSKSLVNGQCGGAKNGKCEVDKEKDCAWENIYNRLQAQNRAGELASNPIELRDYSKVDYKFISSYVSSIREKRLDGYYGGLHPSERKELSEHIGLAVFPEPATVVIPLSQHTGAPAQPLVSAGEHVKLGQKIGEAAGYVSAMLHASVSGEVTAVEPRKHPTTGADVLSVVIRSDGKNELHESVKPYENPDSLTADDILEIVREKGLVGMGGAAFPTAVKLKSAKPIDTVLLNGCECEPLLTADHHVMLNYADDIIYGLKVLLRTVGAEKGIIVVEDNKPDVIALLESKTSDIGNIEILEAKTKYPQGAEKMLIKKALGRQVPSGGLPLDVGVVVSNVSTVKAVSDAIQKGMPLIERVVTVTGEKIEKPGNYIVKIGTPVMELVSYCGGVTDDDVAFKLGGPMMGVAISDLNVPVLKGTNGVIAFAPEDSEPSECIRCGRCVDVCPMELYPLYFPKYAGAGNWQGVKDKNVRDCMECGCCDFICSAKIPIRDAIKLGKKEVAAMERKD
ncbi:MAG: electron transport complex subunit RsxC [Oscillospiraceae bacterium]|nr:electron transport complex subunit RsxC [Oscillospiraceae bacterium]